MHDRLQEKEKTDPVPSGGSKLFSQRRVYPTGVSESAGTTRPHTEPGRARTQMISEEVENITRQSVHDVVTGSEGPGTEKGAQEEGWVMVEK